MKLNLWLALVCIPMLLAIALITAAFVYATPAGSWQLYWSWGKPAGSSSAELGKFYNGTLSGSAESFTFTGGGVTCSGGGIPNGPATMDCSGPDWSGQVRGLFWKRPIAFMFYGTGFGERNGIANSVDLVSLQVTG